MTTFMLALVACLAVYCTTRVLGAKDDFYVNITILESATAQGAVCLDGSPPAYHLDRGHGTGLHNWIINLDENKLYFRGARIFKAIMEDLWSKGMKNAENAILSGTSAGGLATILNCDKFKCLFTKDARVKCVADAGFFINGKTIYGTSYIQEMFRKIVNLHGSTKNLPSPCTSVMKPSLCFFPQNVIPYIQTPLFIINSIYDYWQINNTLVPVNLDPQHAWKDCTEQINNCTFSQRIVIQAFGMEFLKTFEKLPPSFTRGYYLTSCFSHGDLYKSAYWFSASSPRLLNKTIAEAVADWYFERERFQFIDPYPCAKDCKLSKGS
ncbi:Pectin acetylesterase 11 [Capsicum chinense]|nr:Pectin acetylesterase 11 [Capsicum chinense]